MKILQNVCCTSGVGPYPISRDDQCRMHMGLLCSAVREPRLCYGPIRTTSLPHCTRFCHVGLQPRYVVSINMSWNGTLLGNRTDLQTAYHGIVPDIFGGLWIIKMGKVCSDNETCERSYMKNEGTGLDRRRIMHSSQEFESWTVCNKTSLLLLQILLNRCISFEEMQYTGIAWCFSSRF